MQPNPPTFILRHRKENLKKCSLRGLEIREDFKFFPYPRPILPDLTGYILLAIDAPPLTIADAGHGLFLLDATWRYAEKMLRDVGSLPGIELRSIPQGYITAYPRRQGDCPDPERGLASIEALYIAFLILGRDPKGLLDNYHWRDSFLEKNHLRDSRQ